MLRKTPQSPQSAEASASASADAPLPVVRCESVKPKKPAKWGARFAESAGETAAECAAICCCCPCFLLDLVVALVVKLPAGLVRRALRRRRWKLRKRAGITWSRDTAMDSDDDFHHGSVPENGHGEACPRGSPSEELLELEKVMRANFEGAGFWRSPSQRE
ncbi:hypothetical protein Cni_G06564 [Canna indica]|uniref:Uncharacterized protein n=1 Tax=Canna indica TaxID=4628 RepID=A0AAQ3K0H4_9LILI|nr:hypothetical protein Cni_G06564 [Canna indica]